MTKQELEKAIENGESVWCLYCNEVYEIKGQQNIQTISKGEIEYFDTSKDLYLRANLLDIYKTKAEAEHYLHHAKITRTETLPFLTWEEFKEKKVIKFRSADNIDCMLHLVDNGDKIALLAYCVKYFKATEENFYKAYDECVRLFKGE